MSEKFVSMLVVAYFFYFSRLPSDFGICVTFEIRETGRKRVGCWFMWEEGESVNGRRERGWHEEEEGGGVD